MDVAVNRTTRAAINKIEAEHYEKYRRLICKLALRMFGRAQAVEPTLDFEELLAMLNEVYVKCIGGFDESKANFTTYLTYACYNQFNRWVEARERERRVVASVSVQQLGAHAGDGEGLDMYDVCSDETAESPEDILERREEQAALIKKMSPLTRQVAALLIKQPPELLAFYASRPLPTGRVNRGPLTIDVVCQYLKLTKAQALALREEILRLTGVDFTRLNSTRFTGQVAFA